MSVFVDIYRYTAEDERREEVRPVHREFLTGLGENLLCAGPFGPDEVAGALLLFQASSKQDALDLTADDPFRVHDLVAEVEVRHWLPALGELATRFPSA